MWKNSYISRTEAECGGRNSLSSFLLEMAQKSILQDLCFDMASKCRI